MTGMEKMKMRRVLSGWMITATTVVALSGCGGGEDGAHVRLINATASTSLDVYTGTDKLISAVTANTASDYATKDEGTYTVNIQTTGGSTTAVSKSLALTLDDHYAFVAYERYGAVQALQITEEEAESDSVAKINIQNLATDAGAVDVYVTGSSDSLSGQSAATSSLAAGSSSGFLSINEGTYRIRVTKAGSKTKVLLDISSLALKKKNVGTLALLPTTGGVLVDGVYVKQQGDVTFLKNDQARVRVIAALTSSATVGAVANSTTLESSLQSTSIGEYSQVTAGTPTLTITVNGATATTKTPTLTAGNDYSVLVYGPASAPQVSVVTDDNRISESGSSYAKVRLAHLDSDSTSALTLYVNNSAKASNLAYGSASTYSTQSATTSGSWLVTSPSNSSFCASTSGSYVAFTGGASYTLFTLVGANSSAPSCLLVQDN
jgi:hypothetical protein